MNLAVLTIIFPLKHPLGTTEHPDAVIDASRFVEVWPTYFDAHRRLKVFGCALKMQSLRARIRVARVLMKRTLQESDSRIEMPLESQYPREQEMMAFEDLGFIESDGREVF